MLPKNDEDSIKKLLEDSLKQLKKEVDEDDSDGARLAAIRDSEDRAKQKFAKTQKQLAETQKQLAELAATQKEILDVLKTLKNE